MITTTLNRATDQVLDRARSLPIEFVVAAPVCPSAHASAHRIAPSTAIPTSTTAATAMVGDMVTNLWLGDAQGKGFGSKYATKRITPGRLTGMT